MIKPYQQANLKCADRERLGECEMQFEETQDSKNITLGNT